MVSSSDPDGDNSSGRLPPAEKDGPSFSRGILSKDNVRPVVGRQFKELEEEKKNPAEIKARKMDIINNLPLLNIANSNKLEEGKQEENKFEPI